MLFWLFPSTGHDTIFNIMQIVATLTVLLALRQPIYSMWFKCSITVIMQCSQHCTLSIQRHIWMCAETKANNQVHCFLCFIVWQHVWFWTAVIRDKRVRTAWHIHFTASAHFIFNLKNSQHLTSQNWVYSVETDLPPSIVAALLLMSHHVVTVYCLCVTFFL